MKRSMVWFVAPLFCLVFLVSHAQANVLNFTRYQIYGADSEPWEEMCRMGKHHKKKYHVKVKGKKQLSIVKLSGKTNHFGIDISQNPPAYIDYHATVPGVKVWISEYPFTRNLDIQTDETGWWSLYVIKYKDVDLEFSFVYEKEGWVTTKTNAITVTDEDNTDLAIQYIDPNYYYIVLKPTVESMMLNMGYPDFSLENALVVTVGKSWASMHDDRLPHGDPGATVSLMPDTNQAIGPIYFNEAVQPDITYPATSVDGGVTWLNVPTGETYFVTAEKPGVEYETVKFKIEPADTEKGIELYIASPPDSVQGDNDSPPGDY